MKGISTEAKVRLKNLFMLCVPCLFEHLISTFELQQHNVFGSCVCFRQIIKVISDIARALSGLKLLMALVFQL